MVQSRGCCAQDTVKGNFTQSSILGYPNDFSNYESPCHPDASNQVSAQSNLQFGRCHLKYFNMATAI